MKKQRAFKFRIYPTKLQEEYFANVFGCCRFIYNKMLDDKITKYEETKESLRTYPATYKAEFDWLNNVDSYALCNEQLHLETAYKNFFRDPKIGFPKYKSKKKDKNSFTTSNVNGIIQLSDNNKYLKICKCKDIRIKCHRQIRGKIKSVTISKVADKYFASILCEWEENIKKKKLSSRKSIGLDYSSSNLYVDSNNITASYPHFYRKAESKLAREQRKLSKMRKGGSNYVKQKLKLSRIHFKISEQRKDYLHKLSYSLATNYDYVCIEDLNMKGISQSLHLGKSTMDNGWGMFTTFLKYKLEDRGKELIKVGKFYPSSKTCHNCGCKNIDLKLSDRVWVCPECGSVIERDYNAAKNILDEGLRMVYNIQNRRNCGDSLLILDSSESLSRKLNHFSD